MKAAIGGYKNGNYNVVICDDGTKIRWNDLDNLTPDFPESIDMKICNRCDKGCLMCHEQSTFQGDVADLDSSILDSLHPYTELAIGGGNPLEHPGLESFLERMKKKKVICNMTVHFDHFVNNIKLLGHLVDKKLIHGLGISVNRPLTKEEIDAILEFNNAVIHVIAGFTPMTVMESIANKGLKILVLGYKNFGRGHNLYHSHLGEGIDESILLMEAWLRKNPYAFKTVSFDNLAIKQLHVRDMVGEEIWRENYMGDDGQYTMYIDLVKKEYAISSISERHVIDTDNIDELFNKVRKDSGYDS